MLYPPQPGQQRPDSLVQKFLPTALDAVLGFVGFSIAAVARLANDIVGLFWHGQRYDPSRCGRVWRSLERGLRIASHGRNSEGENRFWEVEWTRVIFLH